jgi:hypothetical protein
METFYSVTFGVLALFTALTLFYENRQVQKTATTQTQQNRLFARFRDNYLVVFSLMMGRSPPSRRAQNASPDDWRFAQLVIGCRAPTCTACTSTMASTSGRLASSSLLALDLLSCSARLSVRWPISSTFAHDLADPGCMHD